MITLKSFYRRLSNNLRIFYRLTELQHQFIADNSTTFKKNSSLNSYPKLIKVIDFLEAIQAYLSIILSKIPIFSPYNVLRLIWDCFIAFLILSLIFLLSLIVFFNMKEDQFQSYFQICFVVFTCNILIYLNTGIVVKGKLVADRMRIAKAYLKQTLILDQIGMIPIYLQIFNQDLDNGYIQLLNILILTKLYEFRMIVERVISVLNYYKNMKNIIDLVRLVFIIGCVCHVFCLFWHGLAMKEINEGRKDTWLHAKNLANESSILIKYIYSFYYLSVTMITVGYGDITPQNPIEMTFTILTMFVTGFFWAYSLNRIGKIISNTEMQDKSYKESMQVIHAFMREEHVDSELRARVSNYLQYYYKESNEVQKSQESVIINQLSDQLKNDLMQKVKGKYLLGIPFISSLGSRNKLIDIMKEVLFSPGEYIFNQDDLDDCSLYYLVKGEVEILQENHAFQSKPILIKTLQKQNYFGEISFITGNKRTASVRANDFCRVYKLERIQFLNLINKNHSDYETFCMIKEAILMKNNYKLAKTYCYSCNGYSHLIADCPKIHFTVSRNLLAIKAFQTHPHLNRQKMLRRIKKINTLNIIDSILGDAYRILNDQILNLSFDSSQLEAETPPNLDELVQEFNNESQQILTSHRNTNKISLFNPKKSLNLLEDGRMHLSQHYNEDFTPKNDCSVNESYLQYDDSLLQTRGIVNIQPATDVDPNYYSDHTTQKLSVSSSQYTDNLKNNVEEGGGSAIKNTFDKLKQPINKNEDLNRLSVDQYEQDRHSQCYDDKQVLDINQISADLTKMVLFPLKPSQMNTITPISMTFQQPKKKQSIIKQVSFKNHEENPLKIPSYNSENIIPSSDCIQNQPLQIQQTKMIDSQYKQQISLRSDSQGDSILDNGSYSSQNTSNKLTAQAYFNQIKSKTINFQIKKAQKQNFNQSNLVNQNISKMHTTEPIRIISNINHNCEDQRKKSLLNDVKNKLLEELNRKPIYEEMKKKKQIDFSIPSFNALDLKPEDVLGFKRYINSEIITSDMLTQNQQSRFLDTNQSRSIIPNQESSKFLSNFRGIEWEYLSLIHFDKAKIFQYYYPLQNYNIIIQRLRKQLSRKADLKSKKTVRACLLNGQRRSPIFEKYNPSPKKIKKLKL